MALGEILKQQRLEHGWTKEYVSERTHMMVRSIDALESENFKRIPAPLYGRGFIKQYCALLGIDAQPLIDEYMARTSANAEERSVVHPVVRDIPDQPLAPIHTAGKRTLPPTEPPRETPAATHKAVDAPEASHTAVPRPERFAVPEPVEPPPPPVEAKKAEEPVRARPASPVSGKWVMPPKPSADIPESIPTPLNTEPELGFMPPPQTPVPPPHKPAPAPAPAPAQPFTLQGDPLPEDAPAPSGRSGLADLAQHPAPRKPRRTVTASADRNVQAPHPRAENLRAIFGPQQPIETPPNPQISTLRHVGAGIAATFRKLTHPKVQRMTESGEPLLTHRMVLKAVTIFGVLVLLTAVVLLFRWVFRQSEESDVESFTAPREVAVATDDKAPFRAPLPEPYFK